MTTRTNKYASNCTACGNAVPAGEGTLEGSRQRGWTVRHVGECPRDGAPLPERTSRPRKRVNTYRFASGHTEYRNARGRCEDAPCCGCCTF